MPGVPSGRGCEACRKQKKKCDQGKPCARCTRLNIECIGSGQRRFIFKDITHFDVKRTDAPPSKSSSSLSRSSSESSQVVLQVSRSPSNESAALALAWIQAIRPSTDLRFNLSWTYGDYLEQVPQRLGRNKAFDAAAAAVVAAHTDYCMARKPRPQTLEAYSHALTILRTSLQDGSINASSGETLCAVSLLMLYQGLTITYEGKFSGHCEGALQLLRVRGDCEPRDTFEKALLQSLRGPILFEAIFNEKLDLSEQEWETLVSVHPAGDNPGNVMLGCVSKLPKQIRRFRKQCQTGVHDPHLLAEATENWLVAKQSGTDSQVLIDMVKAKILETDSLSSQMVVAYSALQKLYGMCYAVAIIAGVLLQAIDPPRAEAIGLDLIQIAEEILQITPITRMYKPMGTSTNPLTLCAAWLATEDDDIKQRCEAALVEHHQDTPGMVDAERVVHKLIWTKEQFFLRLYGKVDLDCIQMYEGDARNEQNGSFKGRRTSWVPQNRQSPMLCMPDSMPSTIQAKTLEDQPACSAKPKSMAIERSDN